jgi:hypothetical protein
MCADHPTPGIDSSLPLSSSLKSAEANVAVGGADVVVGSELAGATTVVEGAATVVEVSATVVVVVGEVEVVVVGALLARLTERRLSPISLAASPRLFVSPWPSCPLPLNPQHFTEPSLRIAQEKSPPVVIDDIRARTDDVVPPALSASTRAS